MSKIAFTLFIVGVTAGVLTDGALRVISVVAGFAVLLIGYGVELLKSGHASRAGSVSGRAGAACLRVNVGRRGIVILDNWTGKRAVSFPMRPGECVVTVKEIRYPDRSLVSSVSIEPGIPEPKIRNRVGVDTGFLILADGEYLDAWSQKEVQDVVLRVLDAAAASGCPFAELAYAGVVRGVVLVPYGGDSVYEFTLDETGLNAEFTVQA